ncbi:hypothetical protein COOONC_24636 [Cooperia oncophora]
MGRPIFRKQSLVLYGLFSFPVLYVLHCVFSWTGGHIRRLWRCQDAKVVFPPCDVAAFLALEQIAEARFAEDNVLRILSIGQIRPEKNHKMQLEVARMVKKKLAEHNDKIQVSMS